MWRLLWGEGCVQFLVVVVGTGEKKVRESQKFLAVERKEEEEEEEEAGEGEGHFSCHIAP